MTAPSTKHYFPIFRPEERTAKFIQFANFVCENFTELDLSTVNYVLRVCNDLARVEFPTNTARDFLSSFERFNVRKETMPVLNQKAISARVYTLVAVRVEPSVVHFLEAINENLKHACTLFENRSGNLSSFTLGNQLSASSTKFYNEYVAKNVRFDFMPGKLSTFPYCRSLFSGKFLTRFFYDKAGNVYDVFGAKVSDARYDENSSVLVHSKHRFRFYVPSCAIAEVTQLRAYPKLFTNPWLMWTQSYLGEERVLAADLERAFVETWQVQELGIVFGKKNVLPKSFTNFFAGTKLMQQAIKHKYSKVNLYFVTSNKNTAVILSGDKDRKRTKDDEPKLLQLMPGRVKRAND